ncbi:MAG: pantetheine-phosphate adenylyltransferase, partial [Muribaculaceae bacterium]|nr:pantetheine-phosphate adenylyltransferase [Muribaculaceae bacterium]
FDPFTIGHLDLADRALSMFDALLIGVCYNINKPGLEFVESRVESIRQLYSGNPKVSVEAYSGLTVDFAKRHGARFIVRGLREVKDFEYERNLADTNSAISDIETVFLIASPELGFVSSSMVRELIANNYDASKFLPKRKNL